MMESSACWLSGRDGTTEQADGNIFFAEALSGTHCSSNWYDGNWDGHPPVFSGTAIPLLGFDDGTASFCEMSWPGGGNPHPVCYAQRYKDVRSMYCRTSWPHGGRDCDWHQVFEHWRTIGQFDGREWHCQPVDYCTRTNQNILNLVGDYTPFNMCRSLEWQVCAALGKLPGQNDDRKIRFVPAPKELDATMQSARPVGKCGGWHPDIPRAGAGAFAYTNDDIYFLQVCIYAEVCENADEMFKISAGDTFRCIFSAERMKRLQEIIQEPFVISPGNAFECSAYGPRKISPKPAPPNPSPSIPPPGSPPSPELPPTPPAPPSPCKPPDQPPPSSPSWAVRLKTWATRSDDPELG